MEANVRSKLKSTSALKSLSEKNHNLARFVDYFVINGLELENGLEAECFTGIYHYETIQRRKCFLHFDDFSFFFKMESITCTYLR